MEIMCVKISRLPHTGQFTNFWRSSRAWVLIIISHTQAKLNYIFPSGQMSHKFNLITRNFTFSCFTKMSNARTKWLNLQQLYNQFIRNYKLVFRMSHPAPYSAWCEPVGREAGLFGRPISRFLPPVCLPTNRFCNWCDQAWPKPPEHKIQHTISCPCSFTRTNGLACRGRVVFYPSTAASVGRAREAHSEKLPITPFAVITIWISSQPSDTERLCPVQCSVLSQ